MSLSISKALTNIITSTVCAVLLHNHFDFRLFLFCNIYSWEVGDKSAAVQSESDA